jgi:hypothetical protein
MIGSFIAMPRSRTAHPLIPPRKVVRLQGSFVPDGKSPKDLDPLFNLWIEVQDHLNRESRRELSRKAKEWRELEKAIHKLSPLITSVLNGDQEAANASPDVSELVPDVEMRRKVFDWYSQLINREPEAGELESSESDDSEEKHAARARVLKWKESIQTSTEGLLRAIESGDAGAAEALIDAVTNATLSLMLATRMYPEVMKEAAAMKTLWPVIAREEPGWEKTAANQIAGLELGKGMIKFKSPLRKVRGSDVQLPGRRWAKAAVRTIDETRWKVPYFFHMVNKLGGSDEWASWSIRHGWDIEDYPSWVLSATKLEPFSVETYDSWKALVREIIREQVPDFHLLPDWATQRATAEANGRGTPGEIQNAILDDIVSALKRLAPDASC